MPSKESCDIKRNRIAVESCTAIYPDTKKDPDWPHCVKSSIRAQTANVPCDKVTGGKRRKTMKRSKKVQKKRRATRAKK